MTAARIKREAERAQLPYQLAIALRAQLDEARKTGGYSAEEWSEVEAKVIELVTEEG